MKKIWSFEATFGWIILVIVVIYIYIVFPPFVGAFCCLGLGGLIFLITILTVFGGGS